MKNIVKNIVISVFVGLLAGNFVFAGEYGNAFFQKKMDELAKSILAKDHAKTLSFYTDDAYSLPSYQPMIVGKKAMANMAKKEEKSAVKMLTMKFTSIKVFGSNERKIQIGKYTLTLTMPGQSKPVPDNGKFMSVWEKQADGSWKVKAEMWNSNMNPWAMMGGDKK